MQLRRQRAGITRVGVLGIALAIASLLLVLDAQRSFTLSPATSGHLPLWLFLSFSALPALLYLAVGGFVWLFARQRAAASAIFGFCASAALCFVGETAAVANDHFFSLESALAAIAGMYLLAVLLLVFPHNYFLGTARGGRRARSRSWWMARLYLLFQSLVLVGQTAVALVGNHLFPTALSETISSDASLLALGGALTQVLIAYWGARGTRERLQMRLLLSGLFLSLAPFLSLSLLPNVFGLHVATTASSLSPSYLVDPQITTGTLGLFALALGYSALRSPRLIMDRLVRRTATVLVAGMAIVVLLSLVIVLLGTALTGVTYAICVAILTALLVASIPSLAATAVERLFFREFATHRCQLLDPDWFTHEGIDFEKAADLLTVAIMDTFDTTAVALYIHDEEHKTYRAILDGRATLADAPQDAARAELLARLAASIHGERQSPPAQSGDLDARREVGSWIQLHAERLAQAKRPLFAPELCAPSNSTSGSLARYFNPVGAGETGAGLLLVPVRAQGKLVGVLLMGERSAEQPWAGPDFEVIRLLLSRFAPILDNCLLAERALRLEAVAATDPLTRLPNHRALLECCEREIARGCRFGRPVAVVFLTPTTSSASTTPAGTPPATRSCARSGSEPGLRCAQATRSVATAAKNLPPSCPKRMASRRGWWPSGSARRSRPSHWQVRWWRAA